MDPYALIAHLYEAEYGALEADVAWFARHAAPGRLLVLACGTGRVARRLALDREVVGLDRSEAQLAVARALAPGGRWVWADMCAFDLGAFGEIIVPNAGFSFLQTRAEQAACLACCRRALPTGGQLVIDVPMPDPAQWPLAHGPERLAWEGVVEGRRCRRTRETWRSLPQQRLELLDRYTVDGAEVAVSRLVLRVMLPGELEWMLESCGFYVDAIVGDYRDGPLRDGCPRILVRAVAA